MIRLKLTRIKFQATALGRPEMYDDYVSQGKIEGNELVVTEAVRQAMRKKYRLRGAGDLVAIPAKPIARGIDALIGTNLVNCGGCAKRQADWNEKFRFK